MHASEPDTGRTLVAGSTAVSSAEPKPASDHTKAMHAEAVADLGRLDPDDYERASRGLLATNADDVIDGPFGPAWTTSRHDFVRPADTTATGPDADWPDAPDTVHPSLWRQAQLNSHHGLFEVDEGLWQVRGYDLANISFIAGDTGWIVIDPLTTSSTAAASLKLINDTLGERPVVAVIYTHSHVDHFGGVLGVTTREAVAAGDVRVIAPEGFLHEAVAENVIAGPAMARRSNYQFGMLLPSSPTGQVDCGLGIAVPMANVDLVAPTESISETGEELTVDGVRIVFQMTPDAEAPAEMNFFFPDHGWLCMAENCTATMHNLVPIRGAQARDSLSWSHYIGEARTLFGAETKLVFASHHWPRWGTDDVDGFLRLQRDLYRWVHDQTMRRANHGLTPNEIAEDLELPSCFSDEAHTHGYYGHLLHNSKAVYQRYLSWYDGNPARLNQHPPAEAGKRYVELAGGADALLTHARGAFDDGDYRWVVEVVNHLVFAEPDNTEARLLQADALEQLGYQSEASTYRNAYLTGAMELRHGSPPSRPVRRAGLLDALTVEQVFSTIAVRLKSEDVVGERVTVNWRFPDLADSEQPTDWLLGLENQALHHVGGHHADDAAATITMDRALLSRIMGAETTFFDEMGNGTITVDGDAGALLTIFGNLDTFESGFNIVEP